MTLDGDALGRLVRETWVAWARKQPDVADHPSWLVGWDDLPERDREVDRRIGQAVISAAFEGLAAHYPAAVFPETGTSRDAISGTALRTVLTAQARLYRTEVTA